MAPDIGAGSGALIESSAQVGRGRNQRPPTPLGALSLHGSRGGTVAGSPHRTEAQGGVGGLGGGGRTRWGTGKMAGDGWFYQVFWAWKMMKAGVLTRRNATDLGLKFLISWGTALTYKHSTPTQHFEWELPAKDSGMHPQMFHAISGGWLN